MARNDTLLARFLAEFCSPVIMVIPTAEVEKASLRNQLLFHELLAAFSHLDGLNVNLRIPGSNISISDCHIRFERSTEVGEKTVEDVENLLRRDFVDFDINHLPVSSSALRNAPPTGWSRKVEEIMMRCMSFNEAEMMSAPLMVMAVVSTSDADPLASLEELVYGNHMPNCMRSGQYDPNTHRIFVVLHDATAVNPDTGEPYDLNAVMTRIYKKYPPPRTKAITFNSLPPDSPNIHQPDMWSRWLLPRFFPHLNPSEAARAGSPRSSSPSSGAGGEQDVGFYGRHLSMEDFMNLREFCVSLFQSEVVPALERRIMYLGRLVKESKKGMQNLFKSFMRKPRDDLLSGTFIGVRYTSDKIESQMLLLADTYFALGAYEDAAGVYKMAKDDFNADKSLHHVAYCLLMLIINKSVAQASKTKERKEHIDQLHMMIISGEVAPPLACYAAVIVSELLMANSNHLFPLDAAHILLGAAGSCSHYPLLCALLTERAASCFLRAGRLRRFAFNEKLCGQRFRMLPGRMAQHATICYTVALLVYEDGDWSEAKAMINRDLVEIVSKPQREPQRIAARRGLLLMLRALDRCLSGRARILSPAVSNDAARLVGEIVKPGEWGSLVVKEDLPLNLKGENAAHGKKQNWATCSTRAIITSDLPVEDLQRSVEEQLCVVEGLTLPEVDRGYMDLMRSENGIGSLKPVDARPGRVQDLMTRIMRMELAWLQQSNQMTEQGDVDELIDSLAEEGVAVFSETAGNVAGNGNATASSMNMLAAGSGNGGSSSHGHTVCLGECVVVRLRLINKLPIRLELQRVELIFAEKEAEQVYLPPTDLVIEAGSYHDVHLSVYPKAKGLYSIQGVRWNLGHHLQVQQKLAKPGRLLHTTLRQRAGRERSPDTIMGFEVGDSYANLQLTMSGLPEVCLLEGELLWATLTLRNEGGASANDIVIKTSRPWCLLYSDPSQAVVQDGLFGVRNPSAIPPAGKSGTLFRFPEGTGIPPGAEMTLGVLLRFPEAGKRRTLGFLASYQSRGEPFQGSRSRTSYMPITAVVKKSQSLSVDIVRAPTEAIKKSLIVELYNQDSKAETVTVEGMYGLGALVRAQLTDESAEDPGRASPAVSSPLQYSDSVRVCIDVLEQETSGVSKLLPTSLATQHDPLSPLSSLLGNSLTGSALDAEAGLRAASMKEYLDKLGDAGPRSIAEVRRENVKKKQAERDQEQGGTLEAQAGAQTLHPDLGFSPSGDAQALAAHEHSQKAICVLMLWSILGQDGKKRFGVHWATHLPFVSPLSLSVRHAPSVQLEEASGKTVVPVTLVLRNTSISCSFRVSAQGMDLTSPQIERSCTNRGLRWLGKTKFMHVCLEPGDMRAVEFKVLASKCGVFDVGRFRVRVEEGDEGPREYTLDQQSLLSVTK